MRNALQSVPRTWNKITEWCVKEHMDYVVVAPDDPLVLGLVDMLNEKGIP